MQVSGQFIELDKPCWSCMENPNSPILIEDDGSCSCCGGKGKILTEYGQELIEFITTHKDLLK